MSLIEVVIAVPILTVGLLGAIVLETSSNRLMATARELNVAVGLARSELAQILSESKVDLAAGAVEPGTLSVDTILTDQVVTFSMPGHTIGDAAPAVLFVELAVQWTDIMGYPQTYTLRGGKR